jgi:molecular chaperone DnaK
VIDWVIGRAIEAQGAEPSVVVLTHPADWGAHRLATLERALIAATQTTTVLCAEPAAAARHVAASRRFVPGATMVICDLGGGTFDVAVVEVTASGFEVLGEPRGVPQVGGADVDDAVMRHVLDAADVDLTSSAGVDAQLSIDLADLRASALEAKEALSYDARATVAVRLGGHRRDVLITRTELERAVRPILAPIGAVVREALDGAGLDATALSAAVLIGGASRMPLVGEVIQASVGIPPVTVAQPKLAVALGAAELGTESLAKSSRRHRPAVPPVHPQDDAPALTKATPTPAYVAASRSPSPQDDAASPIEPRRRGGLFVGLSLAVIAAVVALVASIRSTADGEGTAQVQQSTTTTGSSPSASTATPTADDIATAELDNRRYTVTQQEVLECEGVTDCTFSVGFDIACGDSGCVLSSGEVPPQPVEQEGSRYILTADYPGGYLFSCDDGANSTESIHIEFRVTDARFTQGRWLATQLTGTLRSEATEAACSAATVEISFVAH